jgi:hypothetical protein
LDLSRRQRLNRSELAFEVLAGNYVALHGTIATNSMIDASPQCAQPRELELRFVRDG